MSTTKKQLYPLKFNPQPSDRVWGGEKLVREFHKPFELGKNIGESWDISGFEESSSIISGGYLDGNSLYDIIETYMGEIVGDDHYKFFGNEFPLLVKILDINGLLSVQVHPDDETAYDRHNCYGKNEAWYVLDAEPDAVIYMGFNRDVEPNEFYKLCKEGRLEEVLNAYHPKKGDFFFIEAGLVHSAGHGVTIAEVQQLSDATYRIYDWGRENNPKTRREMHLELAFDCINYKKYDAAKYFIPAGGSPHLAHNQYFTINRFDLKDSLHIYTHKYNSFIIYFCAEGRAKITPDSFSQTTDTEYFISKGEWILVPAAYEDFVLAPCEPSSVVLEVYVDQLPEEPDTYVGDSES